MPDHLCDHALHERVEGILNALDGFNYPVVISSQRVLRPDFWTCFSSLLAERIQRQIYIFRNQWSQLFYLSYWRGRLPREARMVPNFAANSILNTMDHFIPCGFPSIRVCCACSWAAVRAGRSRATVEYRLERRVVGTEFLLGLSVSRNEAHRTRSSWIGLLVRCFRFFPRVWRKQLFLETQYIVYYDGEVLGRETNIKLP